MVYLLRYEMLVVQETFILEPTSEIVFTVSTLFFLFSCYFAMMHVFIYFNFL